MLSQNLIQLINEQIIREFYSAYIYLDIANYYNGEGLEGFENWFYVQAQEESAHAMLMRTYLLDSGVSMKLLPVEAPDQEFKNFAEPLNTVLIHERMVTSKINEIYAAAYEEKDFRTMQFLDWFVKEQGEEEKNANDLIKKFELFGMDAKGLYQLDQELKGRTFIAPVVGG